MVTIYSSSSFNYVVILFIVPAESLCPFPFQLSVFPFQFSSVQFVEPRIHNPHGYLRLVVIQFPARAVCAHAVL